MPQPLPNGKSVTYGPDTLLKKPELAAKIGNVCANWALIENDIMHLYALLMGKYAPSAPGFAPPTHPVAYQIFDSLISLRPRLDLLIKLAEWCADKSEYEHLRNNLWKNLKKPYEYRNICAHSVWGACDDYPDAIIRVTTYGANQVYKAGDFDTYSKEIIEQHLALGKITKTIFEKLQKQTPPGPQ